MSPADLLSIHVGIVLLTGVVALAFYRRPAASTTIGVAGIILGCLFGLIPAISALTGGTVAATRWSWNIPGGSLSIGIDVLSAVFLTLILTVSIPISLYGASYLRHHHGSYNIGMVWFFTCLLISSMAVVVMARNAVLFLVAWEVMSVSSYFLVTLDHEKRSVRRAGLIYLIASHIGVAFLMAFFLILGTRTGTFDLNQFGSVSGPTGLLFLLALIGFGSKAGFIPFHVWLPEAHPAAPSHISALMSGVMIKIGVYGLIRAIIILGPPPYWWGGVLIAIGLVSAFLGILSALMQSNIKRLLAYSSVENAGIIAIGLGVGILGWASHSIEIAVLGVAGALLHVVNHALFKGALFLAAGSVLQGCGTLEFSRLGGLFKRMPQTSIVVLVGSVAIVGLPLGNGFVSEFLIYMGALRGALVPRTEIAAVAIAVVIGLAVVGGLAAICFTKLVGIGFLGEPRSQAASDASESTRLMTVPMLTMAALCIVIGLNAYAIPKILIPVVGSVLGIHERVTAEALGSVGHMLTTFSLATGALVAAILGLALCRHLLIRTRSVRTVGTWDCGYTAPNSRMQYSGFSYVRTTASLMRRLVFVHKRFVPLKGFFPRQSSFVIRVQDAFLVGVYEPLFRGMGWMLGRLRWLQHGNVHLYILYILITMLALLFWGLR